MKMDSWKTSMQNGFLFGFISCILLAVFTAAVYFMCGKENYIAHEGMKEAIGGLSFMNINVFGAILAAAVPFFLLRYDSVKYVSLCFVTAAVTYILLFFFLLVVPEVLSPGLNSLFETFDAKFYATITFPLGTVVGTVWSIVFRSIFKLNK